MMKGYQVVNRFRKQKKTEDNTNESAEELYSTCMIKTFNSHCISVQNRESEKCSATASKKKYRILKDRKYSFAKMFVNRSKERPH